MNRRINAANLLADSYSPLTPMVMPVMSLARDICFSQDGSFLKLYTTRAEYESNRIQKRFGKIKR